MKRECIKGDPHFIIRDEMIEIQINKCTENKISNLKIIMQTKMTLKIDMRGQSMTIPEVIAY